MARSRASHSTRPMRITSAWWTGSSAVEAVAEPPHGEEVDGGLGVRLQLEPQLAHEVVHRAGAALVGVAPGGAQELLAAERASRVCEEVGEQLELLRGELHGLARAAHGL